MPDTGGLIFDLDDTLALTTPIWSRAGVAGLEPLGREWTAELTNRCKGMNIRDVAATVHRLLRLDAPLPIESGHLSSGAGKAPRTRNSGPPSTVSAGLSSLEWQPPAQSDRSPVIRHR